MKIFYDFYYFYATSKLIIDNKNVYDTSLLYEELIKIGWDKNEGVLEVLYPPTALPYFIPLGYLPFNFALSLWLIILIISISIAIKSWVEILTEYNIVNVPKEKILFSLLFFFPIYKVFLSGQISFLIFLGITFFIKKFYQRKYFTSGLFFSFCLIKPQVLISLIVFVLLKNINFDLKKFNFLSKSNYLFFAGILTHLTVLTLIVLFYDKSIFQEFISHLSSLDNITKNIRTPTTYSILNIILSFCSNYQIPLIIFPLLGIGIGVYLYFKQSLRTINKTGIDNLDVNEKLVMFNEQNTHSSVASKYFFKKQTTDKQQIEFLSLYLIPISLLTCNFLWSHEFILLVPAFIFLVSRIGDIYSSTTFKLILFSQFFLAFILTFVLNLEYITFFIPLLILLYIYKSGKISLSFNKY